MRYRASAAIACRMLELAKAMEEDGEKYKEFALFLLRELYEDYDFSDKNQAILLPQKRTVDTGLILSN